MNKSLMMVINDPDFFLSHRLPIALKAKEQGYDVYVVTADKASIEQIKNIGLKHIVIPLSRKGMNPFLELRTIFSLYRLFRKIRPSVLHLVTIKPVIYGCIAARLASIDAVVAAVSGLGSTFIANSLTGKLVRFGIINLYKIAFSLKNLKVIFQNTSDLSYFVSLGIIDEKKAVIIRGSGVDLRKYNVFEEPAGTYYVSMAARILKDKGVYEFIEAARLLTKERSDIKFRLIGKLDFDNPTSIAKEEVDEWCREGVINFLGFRTDIADLFSDSHLIVLPSYREGLPKVLVEAAACGRAVITTDVPGCRDAILPDITGVLVPLKDPVMLAEKVKYLIDNPSIRKGMGTAGRELAEQQFDISSIVKQHLEIYEQVLSKSRKSLVLLTTNLLIVKFFLHPLIEQLKKIYDITLVVNVDDEIFLKKMNLDVHVIHLGIQRRPDIFLDISSLIKLIYLCFKIKPDVVHSVAPKAGLLGMVASWIARVPLRIHTFQGEVWANKKGLWRNILKFFDKIVGLLATHLLVVSRSEKDYLIKQKVINDKKSTVLGSGSICGVDTKKFKPDANERLLVRKKLSIQSDDTVFLYMGRLNRDKGIFDLIAAYKLLILELPEEVLNKTHLLIVGPDEEYVHAQYLKINGSSVKNVYFEPYTDYPEQYMSASDILILPSYREGFGLVIVEAAAVKVPAIGSNVYGISDAIVDGETGVLFDVGDIVDLSIKMKNLLLDRDLRCRLAEAAYKRCKSDFTQEYVVKETLSYYQKVLDDRHVNDSLR